MAAAHKAWLFSSTIPDNRKRRVHKCRATAGKELHTLDLWSSRTSYMSLTIHFTALTGLSCAFLFSLEHKKNTAKTFVYILLRLIGKLLLFLFTHLLYYIYSKIETSWIHTNEMMEYFLTINIYMKLPNSSFSILLFVLLEHLKLLPGQN